MKLSKTFILFLIFLLTLPYFSFAGEIAHDASRNVQEEGVGNPFGYTDRNTPEDASTEEIRAINKKMTVQEVKYALYKEIDEHWDLLKVRFGQPEREKLYALLIGLGTRESTLGGNGNGADVETAQEEGFGVNPAHAYGTLQTAVTAFAGSNSKFMVEDNVPELYQFKLSESNFYDAVISDHMGLRKLLHFVEIAINQEKLKGYQVPRAALKGFNTGWCTYVEDDSSEYYKYYPDEIAAMAHWYYAEGHLYDNVFAWTSMPDVEPYREGNRWEWWGDGEPSMEKIPGLVYPGDQGGNGDDGNSTDGSGGDISQGGGHIGGGGTSPGSCAHDPKRDVQNLGVGNPFGWGERNTPADASISEIRKINHDMSVQQVKYALYKEIDEHWELISTRFGQPEREKVYAYFLGLGTRESTLGGNGDGADVETAQEEGFGVSAAHAYGTMQTAVTAFSGCNPIFMKEDNVPELFQYELTESNFYDAIISNHMGIRKLLHFVEIAINQFGLKGYQVPRAALKGFNTGWCEYVEDDSNEYYKYYPDEIAAMAHWYYANNHLYDNVFTWTSSKDVEPFREGDRWEWWGGVEPSMKEVGTGGNTGGDDKQDQGGDGDGQQGGEDNKNNHKHKESKEGAHDASRNVQEEGVGNPFKYTDRNTPENASTAEIRAINKKMTVQEVKYALYKEIDEHWDLVKVRFGQPEREKLYALFLGLGTRESTLGGNGDGADVETAEGGGFGVNAGHAYGTLQTAVTAFADADASFVKEENVPEMKQYKLTESNFYDAIISNHMGIRKLLHFIEIAINTDKLTGNKVVIAALKGFNTGWSEYIDNGENDYYKYYPDEIAALAHWYYDEGHLYDNVFTWVNSPDVEPYMEGDRWEWWEGVEPSMEEVKVNSG